MQEKLVFVTLATFKQQNRLTFASTNVSISPTPLFCKVKNTNHYFYKKNRNIFYINIIETCTSKCKYIDIHFVKIINNCFIYSGVNKYTYRIISCRKIYSIFIEFCFKIFYGYSVYRGISVKKLYFDLYSGVCGRVLELPWKQHFQRIYDAGSARGKPKRDSRRFQIGKRRRLGAFCGYLRISR